MSTFDKDLLRRLGDGEPIASVCQSAGWTTAQFESWWKQQTASRAARCDGQRAAKVSASVTIERDRLGIPHICAENHRDLFFAFGYAMAQDRLFQMDYLRRKGRGRLAEVLGKNGLASDLVARTVGLNRIATAEWEQLPAETRELHLRFSPEHRPG